MIPENELHILDIHYDSILYVVPIQHVLLSFPMNYIPHEWCGKCLVGL